MAVWPSSLPQELINDGSYNEEYAPNTIDAPVTQGPAMRRPRYTRAVQLITGYMYMTQAQWDTFKTFYVGTLKGGSLKFNFSGALTTDTILTDDGGNPLLDDSDNNLVVPGALVRFVSPPKRTRHQLHYRVAMELAI